VSARERRFLLNHLTRQAASDVAALWRSAQQFAEQDFVGFIIDGYPQIVDGWNAVAADLAAVWFEQSVPGAAVTADPIPVDRLESSARWAVYGGEPAGGLGRLQQTTQRSVYDGARKQLWSMRSAQARGGRATRSPTRALSAGCWRRGQGAPVQQPRHRGHRRSTSTVTACRSKCRTRKRMNCPSTRRCGRTNTEKRAPKPEPQTTQVLSAWRQLSGIH
jgi:hypothetical protein